MIQNNHCTFIININKQNQIKYSIIDEQNEIQFIHQKYNVKHRKQLQSLEFINDEEIKEVPYVMEAIELLFVAWFIQCEDDTCARDALRLYEFVKEHENEMRNISSVTKNLQL